MVEARIAPRTLWMLLLLTVLVALPFLPGLSGGFLLDDYVNLVGNEKLRLSAQSTWTDWWQAVVSGGASHSGRPVSMLSFALDARFHGLAAPGWKLSSLIVHVINAALTWLLLSQLLGHNPDRSGAAAHGSQRRWLSLLIASLWAVHPLQVSTVLYVVQRMEMLAHMGVLLAACCYLWGRTVQIRGERGGWGWLAASALAGLLGVLAKESAALGVFLLLLIELLVLRGKAANPRNQVLLRRLWLALGTLAVTGLVAASLINSGPAAYASRDFTWVERLLTEARVMWMYAGWSLWPSPSHYQFYYDNYSISRGLLDPWTTLPSVVGLAGIVALIVVLRRRQPLVALGLGWFLCAHLLTSGPVPLELVFEHRNYASLLGLLLALVVTAAAVLRTTTPGLSFPVLAGCGLLVVAVGMRTWSRAIPWSDPLVLARHMHLQAPDSARAAHNLGVLLSTPPAGGQLPPTQLDEALATLRAAQNMRGATALSDQLLLELYNRNRPPEPRAAWQQLQRRLAEQAFDQNAADAIYGLVRCQVQQHCHYPQQELTATLSIAAARGGARFPDVLYAFADYAWQQLGDAALAERLLRDAVKAAPDDMTYRLGLAGLLIGTDQLNLAANALDEVSVMQLDAAQLQTVAQLRAQIAQQETGN